MGPEMVVMGMSEISPEAQAAAQAAQQAVENIKSQEELERETANAEMAAIDAADLSHEASQNAEMAAAVSIEAAEAASEASIVASEASAEATQANANAAAALSDAETLRQEMAAGFAGIHALFREQQETAQNENVAKVPANVGTTGTQNQDTSAGNAAGQSSSQGSVQPPEKRRRHRFGH